MSARPMRVWVIYSDRGMNKTTVQAVATDTTLTDTIRAVGDELRRVYDVHGRFTKVTSPEPYFRDDERVYRCAWLTVVARPFTVEVHE